MSNPAPARKRIHYTGLVTAIYIGRDGSEHKLAPKTVTEVDADDAAMLVRDYPRMCKEAA